MFKGESREPCIAHAKAPEYPAGKQTRQARRMRSRTCSLSTPRVSSLLSQTLMHLGRNERTISRVPIMKAVPKFLSFPFGFFTNSDWIHGAFRIHVWRNAVFRSSSGGPRLAPAWNGRTLQSNTGPKGGVLLAESCWPICGNGAMWFERAFFSHIPNEFHFRSISLLV